jgi:hypothetical protein
MGVSIYVRFRAIKLILDRNSQDKLAISLPKNQTDIRNHPTDYILRILPQGPTQAEPQGHPACLRIEHLESESAYYLFNIRVKHSNFPLEGDYV